MGERGGSTGPLRGSLLLLRLNYPVGEREGGERGKGGACKAGVGATYLYSLRFAIRLFLVGGEVSLPRLLELWLHVGYCDLCRVFLLFAMWFFSQISGLHPFS